MALAFELRLPPQALSPNVGGHWGPKLGPKIQYRDEAETICTGALNLEAWKKDRRWLVPTRVRLTFAFGTAHLHDVTGRTIRDDRYRPTDPDNALASLKAAIDGCRRAGLMKDDRHAFVEYAPVSIDDEQGPWVRVTVEDATYETRD